MTIIEQQVPPLAAGDRLSREQFLELWDAHPEIKLAELIGGIVYMPSPLSVDHGGMDADVSWWLVSYKVETPGTACEGNATTFLLEDSPQPDLNLRILPECGGKSHLVKRKKRRYLAGIPELLSEVSLSSLSYDLHQKLELYQKAGIPEYLAILLYEREIRWHQLIDGVYHILPPDDDGIWRSRIFPGLWLDGQALLAGNLPQVRAKLEEGLQSPPHQAFVEKLAEARRRQQ